MAFNFSGTNNGSNSNSGRSDDPLKDVEYTDDLNHDASSEFAALQEAFKSEKVEGMAKRADAERKRFKQATDSEFWFAVCFKSREEKESFLKAMNLAKNIMGDKYIDGHKWAQILGIDL